MCGSRGGKGGDGGAAEREKERQSKIAQGMTNINSAFSQFDQPFFDTREQAYLEFALPQLEDQYEKEKEQLVFALARNKRLNSNTRSDRLAELEKQYNIQRTKINDNALGFANKARADIENARANLVSQNASLQNPSAVADLASQRAVALSAAPQFDPLGNLFQNTTAGIATAQQAQQKRDRLNQLSNLYLAEPTGPGSSRVVN